MVASEGSTHQVHSFEDQPLLGVMPLSQAFACLSTAHSTDSTLPPPLPYFCTLARSTLFVFLHAPPSPRPTAFPFHPVTLQQGPCHTLCPLALCSASPSMSSTACMMSWKSE
jgi:hypothetical protein